MQRMEQIKTMLSPYLINMILTETHDKWRECKAKPQIVSVGRLRDGIVFANKTTQAESHRMLKTVSKGEFSCYDTLNDAMKAYLNSHGFYITTKNTLIVCNAFGELRLVPENYFGDLYVFSSMKYNEWVQLKIPEPSRALEVGIRVPLKYKVGIQSVMGVEYMNNLESDGHYNGDILVCSRASDGTPDFNSEFKVIPNINFAYLYDIKHNYWDKTGYLTTQSIKPVSKECVNKLMTEASRIKILNTI